MAHDSAGPTVDRAPWITTERLVLRRPTGADLDDYVRLHTDPRTYAHSPSTMPTPDGCRVRLADDLDDWERDDLGYAALLDRASGEVIGWAGMRRKDAEPAEANLYYRLAYDRLGSGLGREVSRALVGWAIEHRPDVAVTALVHEGNDASVHTAERAGLRRAGTRVHPADPPGSAPMLYFVAPTVRSETAEVDDRLVASLLDLWMRVNDAGGSVGFLPGAPRRDVAAALERQLTEVRAERTLLCLLRDADGSLQGFGLWEHSLGFPQEHVAVLKRLMVEPSARGRNLGRLLLAGMVGIARRELPAAELMRLDYRDGLGLGEFYGRAGWTEVGRIPGGLRLTESDYRDDVAMVRRVDGTPLR